MREPIDYIYDAGLFAETYPCQPRYIRTGDGKLVINAKTEQAQAVYLADHVVPVLEAAVFADQWGGRGPNFRRSRRRTGNRSCSPRTPSPGTYSATS